MSIYMPIGAHSALETQHAWEYEGYIDDMIRERQLKEDYEEAVYKFYQTGLTMSGARAMANLWARACREEEWTNEDVRVIAKSLDLDYKDALLILGEHDEYISIAEGEDKFRPYGHKYMKHYIED